MYTHAMECTLSLMFQIISTPFNNFFNPNKNNKEQVFMTQYIKVELV